MLIRTVAMVLLLAGTAVAATKGHDAFGNLVKGKTTVADVEQTLGAPMDTAMAEDGALTLTYPATRVSSRLPENGRVAMRFAATAFTLQASTVTVAYEGAGVASK